MNKINKESPLSKKSKEKTTVLDKVTENEKLNEKYKREEEDKNLKKLLKKEEEETIKKLLNDQKIQEKRNYQEASPVPELEDEIYEQGDKNEEVSPIFSPVKSVEEDKRVYKKVKQMKKKKEITRENLNESRHVKHSVKKTKKNVFESPVVVEEEEEEGEEKSLRELFEEAILKEEKRRESILRNQKQADENLKKYREQLKEGQKRRIELQERRRKNEEILQRYREQLLREEEMKRKLEEEERREELRLQLFREKLEKAENERKRKLALLKKSEEALFYPELQEKIRTIALPQVSLDKSQIKRKRDKCYSVVQSQSDGENDKTLSLNLYLHEDGTFHSVSEQISRISEDEDDDERVERVKNVQFGVYKKENEKLHFAVAAESKTVSVNEGALEWKSVEKKYYNCAVNELFSYHSSGKKLFLNSSNE